LTKSSYDVELANKHLISDQLWARLVARIAHDKEIEEALAERVLDQALAFLQFIAASPDKSFSPSPLVDTGWHTFILYTREYAAFCDRVAGKFIHHEPSDQEGVDYSSLTAERTVQALQDAGIAVDLMLWTSTACCGGDCSGCSGQ
jgi:hypothetical protein